MSTKDFIIMVKKGSPDEQLAAAKKEATDNGGTIKSELPLIRGFTVSYPADAVHTFSSNEHVHVEEDGEVRTQ